MSDLYSRMDHQALINCINVRGYPKWADLSDSEIRELLRLDDQDVRRRHSGFGGGNGWE